MNVHLGPYINVEQEPSVSTESRVTDANVRQDTRETDNMVVNKERLKLDVAQILIVLTMLNA